MLGNPELQREFVTPLTLAELQERLESVRKKLKGVARPADVIEVISTFRDTLHDSREKFKFVFITESGSEYFTLGSGETLRIGAPNATRPNDAIKPITRKIFFLDPMAVAENDWSDASRDSLVGVALKATSLRPGSRPIEFGLITQGLNTLVEEKDGYIVMRGLGDISESGQVEISSEDFDDTQIGTHHLGSPVKEVFISRE
jgi:hypothetical protein